jgi:hypothetical protein
VGIMAAAFGQPVTAERLRIYADDLLSDLSREQLEIALTRARRELKYFPQIAELRELAGAKPEMQRQVEAEAAWAWAQNYLRKWGVDHLPIYSGGKKLEAPPIPERIEYALRRIGGIRCLNQVTTESYPFVLKDFCAAYNQAETAYLLAPQLAEKFPDRKLLGEVKQLAGKHAIKARWETKPAKAPSLQQKKIPEPLTEANIRDRREMLRQQASKLPQTRHCYSTSAIEQRLSANAGAGVHITQS